MTLLALGLLAACQAKSKGGDDRDSGDPGTSGPGAGNRLPSCASDEPVLTQLPHALSDLRSLGPLGHLAPSPHTFPTDHMYFSFVAGTVVPLVSPGKLTVTRVAVTDYLGATPPFSDYAVTFRPCVGTSTSASGLSTGVYFFHPTSTGNVNRDFKDVTADGSVYCYEQFSGVVQGGVEEAISPQTLLIQLTSSTTLRMERRQETACAAIGAWTFDDRATDFER